VREAVALRSLDLGSFKSSRLVATANQAFYPSLPVRSLCSASGIPGAGPRLRVLLRIVFDSVRFGSFKPLQNRGYPVLQPHGAESLLLSFNQAAAVVGAESSVRNSVPINGARSGPTIQPLDRMREVSFYRSEATSGATRSCAEFRPCGGQRLVLIPEINRNGTAHPG